MVLLCMFRCSTTHIRSYAPTRGSASRPQCATRHSPSPYSIDDNSSRDGTKARFLDTVERGYYAHSAFPTTRAIKPARITSWADDAVDPASTFRPAEDSC